MLSLIIGGAVIAGLAAVIVSSDPEYVQVIKEAIYWLVKTGYDPDKIMQIMHFYVNY
jgi:hypothetical protein